MLPTAGRVRISKYLPSLVIRCYTLYTMYIFEIKIGSLSYVGNHTGYIDKLP